MLILWLFAHIVMIISNKIDVSAFHEQ